MSSVERSASRLSGKLEPAWEIAQLFPYQGCWNEDEYPALEPTRQVELSNGSIEVLPMPVMSHETIVKYLYGVLLAFASAHGLGEVYFAGIRVRLWSRTIRHPDVAFMPKDHEARMREEYGQGADLVMGVVSGGAKDGRRDLVTKRREYAKARIPEYWIVDPKDETITVLRLSSQRYAVHAKFGKGEQATSHLLQGFAVNVSEVFSQRIGKKPAAKKPRKTS